MKTEYNSHGLFEVTTEGDQEGKTIRHLGSFVGFIDDIHIL